MSVKIVIGSIGSGKTRYCTDEIAKVRKESPNRRCIMLVPTHCTHETESMLIDKFGGTGLNHIECTSFEKLAREIACKGYRRLGAPGKHALICRAISLALQKAERRTDFFDHRLLRALSKKGFTDIGASLISEMRQYNISSDTLFEASEKAGNPLLSQKLVLLSYISEFYDNLLANTEYTDCDDDLSRLASVIDKNIGKNDSIWIDNFDEFLPQQTEVLFSLIQSGADITVTFNVCPNDDDTYYATKKAISDICGFAQAQIIRLDSEMNHVKSDDLRFLFGTWFDKSVYDKECKNIEICASRDAYKETERIARKILDLVREDGYRFYDIGIICGTSNYSHIIESIFDEYEIPYYTDERIAVSEYPIAMQLLSLFDVIENNWDYNSMFEYLRAGFIYTKVKQDNGKIKFPRLNPDDVDLLENFVLRSGTEYKNAWCRSWLCNNRGIVDTAFEKDSKTYEDIQEIDKLRTTVITPILNYSDAVKRAVTLSDYCRALFAFLEDINLYSGLKSEILSMALSDASADAQRFGQIWNLMLDVLDQLNTALGDTEVTHSEFARYVTAAINQCQIRTVPSGTDRVFIGSADMNRAIPTPVVFAMGAVSGTFPQTSSPEGFLSDSDRDILSDMGIRTAPVTGKKTEHKSNTIYKLLSSATDRLYISYPSMTSDGAANLPSQIITDITDKFNGLKVSDDIISESNMLFISTPKATLHGFLIAPKDNPLWHHVDSWFCEHGEWKNRLFRINNAKHKLSNRRIELDKSVARALYDGNIRYSATRLNSYASCPFRHHMQYGLRAKERDIYDIKPTDTGTYAHEIIRRFCIKIDEDANLDWKTVSDEECTKIVSDIVSETIEKISNSDLRDKEMTADILRRMGKTSAEAAKTVCRSLRCGEFRTEAYEREVLIKLTDDIEVGGIIDRLDVCRLPDRNEYRIIDYKTGIKDFSVADVYYGLDMQPVIYALAMRMLDEKAVISGLYYGMVHNDFASVDATSGEKKINTELRKNTAYNGLTFIGNDKNTPIDEAEMSRIESELSRSEGSLFFSGRTDEFGYGKNVRTRPEGELLTERVFENIINADRDIKSGNISQAPLVHGSKNACTYCAYSSVCNFDGDTKTERRITETDAMIWSDLEEEK